METQDTKQGPHNDNPIEQDQSKLIEQDRQETGNHDDKMQVELANEDSERSPHIDPATPLAVFDLWEICYHICFTNYPLDAQDSAAAIVPAAIVDVHLLDEDGEVDWEQVDQKTSRVVQHLFNTAESR